MRFDTVPTAPPQSTMVGGIARRLPRNHRINWVLISPTGHHPAPLLPGVVVRPFGADDRAAITNHGDGDWDNILRYADSGATGHVLEFSGEIASVAHYVDRPLYTDAATWPLRCDEMALVHIATRPAFRCLGFASTLIANATPPTLAQRADAAICLVRWNHWASLRAFRHAGWQTIGLSVELVRSGGRVMRFHIPLAPRRLGRR